MAKASLQAGYELEIDQGQIYLGLGEERVPILMLELNIGSRLSGGLSSMEIDAKFITSGGPEPRGSNTVVIVPSTTARRLRVRR